jgi:hypothetical protein
MMQTDVKAKSLAASGVVFAGPTRVKGLTVSFATGGTVELKDGGSGGTSVFTYTAPAAAGTVNIVIPGEGVKFNTSVYAVLTDATVVAFYG